MKRLLEVLQAVILILFIVFDRLLQRLPSRPRWGQAPPGDPAIPATGETA